MKIVKGPNPPGPPGNVTVEMTSEEAAIIVAISWRMGGAPEGPRGTMQRMAVALADRMGFSVRATGDRLIASGPVNLVDAMPSEWWELIKN